MSIRTRSLIASATTGLALLAGGVATQSAQAAPIVTQASCGVDSYANTYGDCVHSPDGDSGGATARCNDGTYSHSRSRSGTCSGHDGVASWMSGDPTAGSSELVGTALVGSAVVGSSAILPLAMPLLFLGSAA
ncbi:DUF3761 domain-containing protein [Speluncibacter jeojiensis]|uniref:DUF3761 domain-containing protein n=2 Tax=Speluncibacter jeojiensis TaxID=2710754 RepID=A0A9X4M0J0_9ACTN|nr:DUF3761 domain-containing protein [Corynebacteriales bacterium D3-21]